MGEVTLTPIQLPPNPAILDTNVLIGYFDSTDSLHMQVVYIVDSLEYSWIVTQAALVEAWGLLGSRKKKHLAQAMVQRVITPGRFFYIDDEPFDALGCRDIVHTYNVDVCDGILCTLSKTLQSRSSYPQIPIFTSDVSDFTRIVKGGVIFDVLNEQPLYMGE